MSNLYVDTTQLEAGEGYVQQQPLMALLGPVVDGERSEPNKCDVKLGLVYSLEGTVAIFFKDLNPNSLYVGKLYVLDKEDGVKTPSIEEISIDGSLRLINASVDLAKSVEKFASVLTQSIKKCRSGIAHTQNVFDEVLNKSVDDMVEVRTPLTALKDIQNLMGFVGTFANRLENHTGKLVTTLAKYPVKF